MPAGTIVLTNNSTVLTGSGTSFTTELKANDFIVAVVGGITYTLGVQSVNSATGVTLITAYNGPNASGVAWTAVPNAALVGITAQVAADVAKAIRGLNLDKQNWQQVYYGSGNITVTLPDGSQYIGPAWRSITDSLAGKLDKSGGVMTGAITLPGIELLAATPYIDFHYASGPSDYNVRVINSADRTLTVVGEAGSGAILNVVGSVTTSTGVTAAGGGINTRVAAPPTAPAAGTETASGLLEAGFSSGVYLGVRSLFHTSVVQGAGTSAIIAIQTSASGAYTRFQFSQGGNAIAPANWVSNSDRRLKKNIEPISEPLEKMRQISGVTWDRVDGVGPGIGFIAQDVQAVFPKNVFISGNRTLEDGSVVEEVLSPDTAGVAAALHHEAILVLMDKVEALEKRDEEKNAIISELRKRMKTIDGLEA